MKILAKTDTGTREYPYHINPEDWSVDSQPDNLVYVDENLGFRAEVKLEGKNDDGEPIYVFVGSVLSPLDEDNVYYYDLWYEPDPSPTPHPMKIDGWELVDWDKFEGEWRDDRYGDAHPVVTYIDEGNIESLTVPPKFIARVREINDKYNELEDIAYTLAYPDERDFDETKWASLTDRGAQEKYIEDTFGVSKWDVGYVLDAYENFSGYDGL